MASLKARAKTEAHAIIPPAFPHEPHAPPDGRADEKVHVKVGEVHFYGKVDAAKELLNSMEPVHLTSTSNVSDLRFVVLVCYVAFLCFAFVVLMVSKTCLSRIPLGAWPAKVLPLTF